jgi:phytanoyl-CoA hydroxylase
MSPPPCRGKGQVPNFDVNLQFLGNTAQYQVKRRSLLVARHNNWFSIMSLTDSQLSEFKENGFLIIKQLVPPSACARMLEVTQQQLLTPTQPLEYEAEVGYHGAPASLDAPGGATIRRLRGAYGRDASFRAWAEDPVQVAKLEQLLGEKVALTLAHHNCIMTKYPTFGTATGWHRDIRYWSYAKPDLVCVWLALGPETEENGGLKFISGSHRLTLKPEQLDGLDFLRPDAPENEALFARGRQVELQQGDVVFFHSRLFHAAGRNNTNAVKTSVVFAYRGLSNAPIAGSKSAAAGEILL